MSQETLVDPAPIREAMQALEISPSVSPNQTIDPDRVFFPDGHRGVLDMRRQLVVGNRGMGKSFWTHALTNPHVREQLARTYGFPLLAKTNVIIGFNGSEKRSSITPTIEEIQGAHSDGVDPQLIWRAVILRAIRSLRSGSMSEFSRVMSGLRDHPEEYAVELSALDDVNAKQDLHLLIVFDALDRLSTDWDVIRSLTRGLLLTLLGLQSFRHIRAKVFMRVDQFADDGLFRFPDSSKLRNDRVDLAWRPFELYGLLLFELLRHGPAASRALLALAGAAGASSALPSSGRARTDVIKQELLINAIAGEYMGQSAKRGRVYSWIPLHLGDAANNCSPRTFLTAWRTAADHVPAPQKLVVDHRGLNEGVRQASSARLAELQEDYLWIDLALKPLYKQFVPMERNELFNLWQGSGVTARILEESSRSGWLAPIAVSVENSPDALLRSMTSIAVMEERANGKINVPDIFRVEAGILRKGGVAVPRKN